MPYGLRGCRQNDLHDQCPLAKCKRMVGNLCRMFGEPCPAMAKHSLSDPEKLAAASERELQDAKLGFRAQRVGEFVRRVVGGDLDLDAWCRKRTLTPCGNHLDRQGNRQLRGESPSDAPGPHDQIPATAKYGPTWGFRPRLPRKKSNGWRRSGTGTGADFRLPRLQVRAGLAKEITWTAR